jgi:hypothetical protein
LVGCESGRFKNYNYNFIEALTIPSIGQSPTKKRVEYYLESITGLSRQQVTFPRSDQRSVERPGFLGPRVYTLSVGEL